MRMIYTLIVTFFLTSAIWSLPTADADQPLLVSLASTHNRLGQPQLAGQWQVPGEFQKPRDTWQVPGEFQQPKGPWQSPGEIKIPKEIETIEITDSSPCERKLSLGSDTLFEFDRFDLSPAGEKAVAALGVLIKEHQPLTVSIHGHTDGKGSDAYNQTLSEKRAYTVANWLRSRDFLPADVSIVGFREKQPLAPNQKPDGSDDPEGRQRNRRVEVALTACEQQ